jgi:phospholipid/cholesterol/gamma-HCH transport system substrate-binding protein
VNRTRTLAFGALGVAAPVLVYLITSSGSTGYIIRAEFRDVDGMRPGSTVKVDGVPGGIVSSVTITPRDTAIATLRVDKAAAPIGAGASVQIRPADLLGEHYVQLDVGNLNRPQPSGTFIPLSRTSATVELDQVLNMLDVGTRTRLRILINEAAVALAGRGADFNTLLSDLPPNLDQARALLAQVSSQNATLQNLISAGDRVTGAVNGRRDQLGNLIGVAEAALGKVADRHAQLGATIADAPGALTQLRTALSQLGTASTAITPAAQSLQTAAGPLTRTLRALPSSADAASTTLVTARQAAPDLQRLGSEGQSPLRSLRPTALHLKSVTRMAAPILTELDQRAMRDALWFVENWALGPKGRDALGHFIGAELELDPSIVTSALDSFLNKPPTSTAAHRRTAAARVPSITGTPAGGLRVHRPRRLRAHRPGQRLRRRRAARWAAWPRHSGTSSGRSSAPPTRRRRPRRPSHRRRPAPVRDRSTTSSTTSSVNELDLPSQAQKPVQGPSRRCAAQPGIHADDLIRRCRRGNRDVLRRLRRPERDPRTVVLHPVRPDEERRQPRGALPVRIGGELAGQVLDPQVYDHLAKVRLQLSSKYKPLLSDTRVAVRLRSAFGIRYVELIPGHNGTRSRTARRFPPRMPPASSTSTRSSTPSTPPRARVRRSSSASSATGCSAAARMSITHSAKLRGSCGSSARSRPRSRRDRRRCTT